MLPPHPISSSGAAVIDIPLTPMTLSRTPIALIDGDPSQTKDLIDGEVNNVDIVFDKELPDELACPCCEQALRLATKAPCGHLYCQECLNGLKNCMVCNAEIPIGSGKLEKNTMRKIQALGVLCSWQDQGCSWRGVLKDLEKHALGCEYREIVCKQGCGQIYAKKNEELHLLEECGRRGVICPDCNKEIPAKAIDVHNKFCGMAIINCPNQCGLENVTRDLAHAHLPLCPKRGNGCPFGEFGCDYAGEKRALQKHISEEPIRHLTYLCDGVVELKMLLTHMQSQMETMTKAMQDLQIKSNILEKLYGSQLVWRIDNFRQKQNEARSGAKSTIFSTPFMSGRHGYKMICSVCPYGDGAARGQYFSIYVAIMRGEFDALLPWPFTHKVTFTLMDQTRINGKANNKTYVVKPITSRENKVFLERPVSERNAAFGAQKFCDLSQLESFIVDDTIFIKVNIDLETERG
ncbi:unnamed protein product, partial [Mesorhabditis belari]|uniref:TNF receptor-associated factor n=1 Tax=Mesorhabditis belari TaxID=2138241 RepID=A0AAF3ET90_9BILA